jgi:protein-S-isoprenylcysteine O-methyltransferase Ste14
MEPLFGLGWFHTELQRDVYQGLFLFFILTKIIIMLVSGRNSGKGGKKAKSDAGSRVALILGFVLVFYGAGFSDSFRNTLLSFCYWLGSAIVLFGILFRGWAVWTLRNYFTLSVQVSENQHIVQSGPCRFLRHPAYTGGVLRLIGFPIGLCSLPGLLAAIVIAALVYGYRIRIEERLRKAQFGKEYEEYASHTWRLLPFYFNNRERNSPRSENGRVLTP